MSRKQWDLMLAVVRTIGSLITAGALVWKLTH